MYGTMWGAHMIIALALLSFLLETDMLHLVILVRPMYQLLLLPLPTQCEWLTLKLIK